MSREHFLTISLITEIFGEFELCSSINVHYRLTTFRMNSCSEGFEKVSLIMLKGVINNQKVFFKTDL